MRRIRKDDFIQIRIDPGLKHAVSKALHEDGWTFSSFIRTVFEDYLEDVKQRAAGVESEGGTPPPVD